MMRTVLMALASAVVVLLPVSLSHAQSTGQGVATQQTPTWSALLTQGLAARAAGSLQDSIDILAAARASASTPEERLRASAELGASLLQAQRLNEAATILKESHAGLQGADKARVALDLGNLARVNHDTLGAQRFYREAADLGAGQPAIALSAALNLVRLLPLKEKAAALLPLLTQLRQLDDPSTRARYLLNFGQQAASLPGDGLRLAFEAMGIARHDADVLASPRLMVEARDALAQIYEDQQRSDDALLLNRAALAKAAAAPQGLVQDILIRLEWRQGRLLRDLGRTDEAVAALERAAVQVEAVRQDLPIEMDDGRSSFSSLLRPIYVDLADLLLRRSGTHGASAALAAINTLEMSRQAEMQDYLGERCAVATTGGAKQVLPAGTSVLYPLVLRDRMELLVKSETGATRHEVKISEAQLRNLVSDLTEGLRNYDNDGYLVPARRLYDLLIRPLEADLAAARIDTLVIASEGFLRPIPLGALHDGKQFLVEKYAIGTITGMSMTDTHAADHSTQSTLLAGLSDPGPVVDVLAAKQIGGVGELNAPPAATTTAPAPVSRSLHLRSMRTRDMPAIAPGLREAAKREAQRDALKLPGVETEIAALAATLPGSTRLLNGEFTVARFRQEATSGSYRIVHIASHGVFGGDANSSFILAHDDVISMNGLQALLTSESIKAAPIELLTLSACETAEGNERAPLGFSGAAIKARARSALGTLWPVADDAARLVMERFYANIARKDGAQNGKAMALRAAQVELLHQPGMAHPFFWAPFTLVGNWN